MSTSSDTRRRPRLPRAVEDRSWPERLKDMISVHAERRYIDAHRHRVLSPAPDDEIGIFTLVDRNAQARPDATMLITADSEITWREFQRLTYRIANLLLSLGLRKGEAVALNMDNSILYLGCVVGITRAGGVVGLINTNLAGPQLVHCVKEVGARISFVDPAHAEVIAACGDDYRRACGEEGVVLVFGGSPKGETTFSSWVVDGDAQLAAAADEPPVLAEPVRARDPAVYLFTSGTTGLPKAAIRNHQKFVNGASAAAVLGFQSGPDDRMYNTLPLYHGAGLMVGTGSCLFSGASMFIRHKFSASAAVPEINKYGCNLMIYIGELCRYMLNTPAKSDDPKCALQRISGNGLRPELWMEFKRRFGIQRITELYGASEGNGGFMNLLNRDATVGYTGSTPRLVDYDTETAGPLRGPDGRVSLVEPGKPGLLLIQVTEANPFEGYRNSAQSEGKLVRDAFAEGDVWFNSGDLLRQVDVGFAFGLPHFQFVDRLGDTFRWRGENVATAEVAEIICEAPQVALACVYGVAVPRSDGKAGMAAILLQPGAGAFDPEGFERYVRDALPSYARPLFVRVCAQLEMTGTHKMVKGPLVKEGYDPERIADPIYAWAPNSKAYERLTAARFQEICAGRSGY